MDRRLFNNLFEYQRGSLSKVHLFSITKDNLSFVQRLKLDKQLKVHNGCVNTVCWNESGQLLLSGSDDRHLIITDPYSEKVKYKVLSGHHSNIFSAKFLPNSCDKRLVSCSGDGLITYTDLENAETRCGYNYNSFDCHFGTVYEVVDVPGDSNSFLSCGEDGTVRWFDLRAKDRCVKTDCTEDVLINCRRAVTSIAVNPVLPWQLSVGCADGTVVIYDRRKLATRATGGSGTSHIQAMLSRFSAPAVDGRNLRITSLSYSDDAEEVLVSYSTDHVYLFNIKEDGRVKKLSINAEGGENADEEGGGVKPPVKRLRLRGDWSDTGPNAVPERERGRVQVGNTAQNIMQRMSDMLTRWLEDAANQEDSGETSENQSEAATGSDNQDEAQNSRRHRNNEELEGVDSSELATVRAMDFGEINVEPSTSSRNEASVSTSNITESQNKNKSKISTCSGGKSEVDGSANQEPDEPMESTPTASFAAEDTVSDVTPEPMSVDFDEQKDSSKAQDYLNSKTELHENQGGCSGSTVQNDSNETMKTNQNKDVNVSNNPNSQSQDSPSQGSATSAQDDRQMRELHRMVHSLKSQSLEPTVSLKYYSQGASTSQIKFSFPQRPKAGHGNDLEQSGSDDPHASTSEQVHESVNPISQLDTQTQDRSQNRLPSANQSDTCSQSSSDITNKSFSDSTDTSKSSVPQEYAAKPKSAASSHRAGPSAEETVSESGSMENETHVAESSVSVEEARAVPSTSASADAGAQAVVRPKETSKRQPEVDDADSSDSDNDTPSDTPDMRTGMGGSSRPPAMRSLEQNLAARRLQRVFRRRQEQSAQQEEAEMDLPKPGVKMTYRGHRNARTMIKQANFWGHDYVLSGSDCGHVFIWDRHTARLVMLLEADAHVVNCVQPHPYDPVLATSGIDYDIKLWGPISPEPCFDSERAAQIMGRNKIMLEETKDTLTVPATFMLRMLASINRVRAARRGEAESSTSSEHDD